MVGRNCSLHKWPFSTPEVRQQLKHYLKWKITVGHYHLASSWASNGAFLGKMVVGHNNSRVMKSSHFERIMRTFMEIAGIVVDGVCENALYSFVNTLFSSFFRKRGFLANCENICWNRVKAEIFMFRWLPIQTAGMWRSLVCMGAKLIRWHRFSGKYQNAQFW